MTRSASRFRWTILAGALTVALAVVVWHDVPVDVTADDRHFAPLFLAAAGHAGALDEGKSSADFEDQVRAIVAVQDSVLAVAPENRAVAMRRGREPKDLFELKHGLCYDRSRVIEKLLRWVGFETRHVSIYDTSDHSTLMALITPQSPSHAISEVRTAKGWMVVDSNARWIGLRTDRTPVSVSDLQDEGAATFSWAPESSEKINSIFHGSFAQIRGLYSRHGNFYPPYSPIPDYNLRQLLGNLTE